MLIDKVLTVMFGAFGVILGSVLMLVIFVVIREALDERRNKRG